MRNASGAVIGALVLTVGGLGYVGYLDAEYDQNPSSMYRPNPETGVEEQAVGSDRPAARSMGITSEDDWEAPVAVACRPGEPAFDTDPMNGESRHYGFVFPIGDLPCERLRGPAS